MNTIIIIVGLIVLYNLASLMLANVITITEYIGLTKQSFEDSTRWRIERNEFEAKYIALCEDVEKDIDGVYQFAEEYVELFAQWKIEKYGN